MVKAYSYVRFSSKAQEQGDSVRRQSQAAVEYASRKGLDLDTTLTFEDLGKSAFKGGNAETGRLGDFLEAVHAGIVPQGSYLLVESLDRVSRDKARKAVRTLEDLCDAGVTVVTLTDQREYTRASLDDDPMAFMYAFMVAIRAHEESATKSRRVRAAWSNKQANAATKVLTSITVAWCRTEGDRIVPIPERVKIVQRMFRMTLDGIGKEAIARSLNQASVEPWGRGKLKATQWHRSYVAKILSNPAVYGVYEPLRDSKARKRGHTQAGEPVPGYYPVIIDRETFDRVQLMKQAKRRVTTGTGELRNLFAGLLKCPTCGGTMTMVSKGPTGAQRKVTCYAAKAGVSCVYRSVPYAPLEEALMRKAEELLDVLPAGVDFADELANLAGAIDATEDQRDNLMQSLQVEPRSPTLLASLRDTEQDLAEMQAEMQTLVARMAETSPRMVAIRSDNLAATLASEPLDRRKANAELRQLFSGIVVDYDAGELTFQWAHGGESSVLYASPFPTV